MTECIDANRAARRTGGPLHAAVVYDSDDALGDRAAPFVREGLDRGETILAVVPARARSRCCGATATTWTATRTRTG